MKYILFNLAVLSANLASGFSDCISNASPGEKKEKKKEEEFPPSSEIKKKNEKETFCSVFVIVSSTRERERKKKTRKINENIYHLSTEYVD